MRYGGGAAWAPRSRSFAQTTKARDGITGDSFTNRLIIGMVNEVGKRQHRRMQRNRGMRAGTKESGEWREQNKWRAHGSTGSVAT
eukprot:6190097-Pleurochrysis_carterae.AAC.1